MCKEQVIKNINSCLCLSRAFGGPRKPQQTEECRTHFLFLSRLREEGPTGSEDLHKGNKLKTDHEGLKNFASI